MKRKYDAIRKNKRFKLLYVLTSSVSYILIEGLIEELTKDFEVYLITSFDPKLKSNCLERDIIYYSTPLKRNPSLFWDLICLIHSFWLILKIRPDIVNYSTPKASFLYSLSTFILGIKNRIYLVRGIRHETLISLAKHIQINVEKICCLSSTNVIALSKSVKENFIKERLCLTKKIRVIGPGGSGIYDTRFSNPSNIEKVLSRKEYKIKHDSFVIGYCGRLVTRKGIDELVEIFKNLRKKYKNIILLLAGSYSKDSPLKISTLESINSNPAIINAGYINQNQLRGFYHCLDLFVSASNSEGFGNTQVEAAKSGLPIVAKNVTGSKDAVKNNFNGTLVKPNSSKDLEKGIEKYILNKEIYHKHSKNSLIWSNKFSRKIITTYWKNFYKDLCQMNT